MVRLSNTSVKTIENENHTGFVFSFCSNGDKPNSIRITKQTCWSRDKNNGNDAVKRDEYDVEKFMPSERVS